MSLMGGQMDRHTLARQMGTSIAILEQHDTCQSEGAFLYAQDLATAPFIQNSDHPRISLRLQSDQNPLNFNQPCQAFLKDRAGLRS